MCTSPVYILAEWKSIEETVVGSRRGADNVAQGCSATIQLYRDQPSIEYYIGNGFLQYSPR